VSSGNDRTRPEGQGGFEEIVSSTVFSLTAGGDIGWLHRQAYDRGIDSINNAVDSVAALIATAQTITDGRRADASSFGVYGQDIGPSHWARRIVGELLDAGWTPPAVRPS
jgi:hypothetical protein